MCGAICRRRLCPPVTVFMTWDLGIITQDLMGDWHAMSKVCEAVPHDSLTQQTCCTVLLVSRLDAVGISQDC